MTTKTRRPQIIGITVTIRGFIPQAGLTDVERTRALADAVEAMQIKGDYGPLVALMEVEACDLRQDKRKASDGEG